MRSFTSILLIGLAAASPAYTYTVEELWAEFDPSRLTTDEKRFLQFGLALEGNYFALTDGAWGAGSQRALEEWALGAKLDPPIENWEVVILAMDIANKMQIDGWEQRYFEGMDISFALPTARMRPEPSDGIFTNFSHTASSLTYSTSMSDLPQAVSYHTRALVLAPPNSSPYTVRREDVLITSVKQQGRATVYIRSDLRRGGWATVLLAASQRDEKLLTAVAGTITKGRDRGITLPPAGEIVKGFASISIAVAEIEEETARGQAGGETAWEGIRPSAPATTDPSTPLSLPGIQAPVLQGTGTGFIVSLDGHILTNAHVVAGCESLEIEGRSVRLLAVDTNFDLALLKDIPPQNGAVARFSVHPAALNADVTVAGYPLTGLLSGLNITRGSVSSLKGLEGNAMAMQISAPVQPGNSGGPAVDSAGRVVGVVVSKLNARRVADETGDIPQNVNFAVRGEMAKLFMFQNGVEPVLADVDAPSLDPVSIGKELATITRMIECYAPPK